MKKLFILFFIVPAINTCSGQETFIKTIDDANSGTALRVLSTSDHGWVVFSIDSLTLYKYSSCGFCEWSKQYSLPNGSYPGDFIKTQNGNFVILSRILKNTIYTSVLTKLDPMGNVIWSKSYEDPFYSHFPYTLNEDQTGHFVIFGNVEHISNNTSYNFICKTDANGNISWTKFYDHGGTWGGAIVTSDNGVLARTGNIFIKTDNTGNVQWSNLLLTSSYYYFAPVEVSDGFVFNGNLNGNSQISFFKMDKLGNQLWNGRKKINYFGIPPFLRNKNNGNFACVFNPLIAGKTYSTIIEFDKDLNTIRQSSLNSSPADFWYGRDFSFSDNNMTVLAGTSSLAGSGTSLFFAKMNNLYQTSCDTNLTSTVVADNAISNFISTTAFSYPLNSVIHNCVANAFSASETTLCSNFIPLQLNIGVDTLVCPGSALTLQNRTGAVYERYLWSTGATSSSITVNQSGDYSLLGISHCGQDTAKDTIHISMVNFPDPLLVADTFICSEAPVIFNAEIPGATYYWMDGSTNAAYHATLPGDYYVDVTLQNCMKRYETTLTDCESLMMPNVFTPNGDHLNDFFAPIEMEGIVSATLRVYNRWGDKVYSTTDVTYGWDGSSPNNQLKSGIYYWILDYTNYRLQKKFSKGTVELLTN